MADLPRCHPDYASALAKARDYKWTTLTSLQEVTRGIQQFYIDVFKIQDPLSTEKTYTDPCHFIATTFDVMGTTPVINLLNAVEGDVLRAAVQTAPTNLMKRVPPRPVPKTTSKHIAQLLHMGFREEAMIRGAPGTSDVLDVIATSLSAIGLQTYKYNLEVLFEHSGGIAGELLQPFSVGISVGGATLMSCYLLAFAVHELELSSKVLPDLWSELCKKMMNVLWLHCDYDPSADVTEQVYKSISVKCQAAARSRPNIIQLDYAFKRTTAAAMSVTSCRHGCRTFGRFKIFGSSHRSHRSHGRPVNNSIWHCGTLGRFGAKTLNLCKTL